MSLDVYLKVREEVIYSSNITHNLNKMADVAGLYKVLWYPESVNMKLGKDLIHPLASGLVRLLKNPPFFKELNPPNGWGTYENLIEFIVEYMHACIENPESVIEVSR